MHVRMKMWGKPNYLVYEGSDGDGPESPGEGVGDERAEQRRHGGGAVEVGEGVGRLS